MSTDAWDTAGMDAPEHAPRIVVTDGHPTDAEVAALVAAVARHRATRAAPAAVAGPAPSRWILAARLEASGHAPIDTPARLAARARRRPSGR